MIRHIIKYLACGEQKKGRWFSPKSLLLREKNCLAGGMKARGRGIYPHTPHAHVCPRPSPPPSRFGSCALRTRGRRKAGAGPIIHGHMSHMGHMAPGLQSFKGPTDLTH